MEQNKIKYYCMTISNLKGRLLDNILVPLCYDINYVLCRTGYVAVTVIAAGSGTAPLQERTFVPASGVITAVPQFSEPCTQGGATEKILSLSGKNWRSCDVFWLSRCLSNLWAINLSIIMLASRAGDGNKLSCYIIMWGGHKSAKFCFELYFSLLYIVF